MKQRRYRFVLTALAAVVLLAAGCSKESQGEDFGDGTYLSLNIDGVKAATAAQSTRATAVNETAVNDVWVLQFQMNAGSTTVGTLVAKSYIATVTDPAKVKFRPIEGNNMALYLVANSGNSSLFSSTANGTTLAAVKATAVTVTSTTGNNFPTETSAYLPMVGQSATLKLQLPTTTAVPVTLTRVAAKVVLTIKNPFVAVYPRLTITGTQLKNVPKAYSTQVITAAGTTYPTALTANFKDYTATGNITAIGKTFTYYLAPNLRGMGTNTDPRLKSDLTAPSGQGAYCTYVEIMGTAKASASAPAVDVRYRLYLGANNTNNFNLYANTAYKVDIELTGINGNDARMLIATDRFDLIQGGTDGDHTGDAGGGWRPLVIGDFRDGGIVYWVDPTDPEKYKVVSLEERQRMWAATNTYVVSAARSDTDGKKNSDAIKAYYETEYAAGRITTTFEAAFPAAAYCYNYAGKDGADPKGTWYLPAKSELQYLWCAYNGKAPISWESNSTFVANTTAQTAFNKYLTDAGGAAITSGSFWSSTESSNYINDALGINLENGYTGSYDKGNTAYVRCVKHIVPPPPAVGNYYYSDGRYSAALQAGKTPTGVIYYVNSADPTKFKVVSLDEATTTLKWAAKNTYVVTAAQSDADGRTNSDAIKAAFDAGMAGVIITESTFDAAFPAAAYCYNYKGKANTDALGSWYLPAKSELQYLWCAFNGKAPISWASNTHTDATPVPDAQAVFNKSLTNAGGTSMASGYFWSSTELSSNASYAWYVYFSTGTTSYSGIGKGYYGYVRCVREF